MIFYPKAEKFKKALKRNGIDGAIILSPENLFYLTGLSGHQLSVSRQAGFSLAVLDNILTSDVYVTTMDFEMPAFIDLSNEEKLYKNIVFEEYTTWVGALPQNIMMGTESKPEKEFHDSFNILQSFIKKLNLNKGKIGIETAYIDIAYFEKLKAAFPGAEFVDISNILVQLRSIKDLDEIEIFKTLCHEADKGFLAVSEIARIGISEIELAHCFRETVIKSGICFPSTWSMFSVGANSAKLTLPLNAKANPGDVVKFDAGVNAGFKFYTTDTSRTWVLPGANAELYELKDRLYQAQRLMLDTIKPGLKFSELFDIGFQYVKEKYPNYTRGHLGHSISLGPATAEEPYITAKNVNRLEVGMILAVEVPCYMPGFNGFNIEDMVLVTESGSEILTPMTPHYLV